MHVNKKTGEPVLGSTIQRNWIRYTVIDYMPPKAGARGGSLLCSMYSVKQKRDLGTSYVPPRFLKAVWA